MNSREYLTLKRQIFCSMPFDTILKIKNPARMQLSVENLSDGNQSPP